MIRLNRMTDYAVVVLSTLALERKRDSIKHKSASEIATRTGIGQPTIAKIMKLLAQAGLVDALRGKDGGYRLARDERSITIAEIIEALEGPIALTTCIEGVEDPCSSRHHCCISGNWQKVNTAIADALSSMTLAEILDPDNLFKPADETEASENIKGVL